MLILRLSALGDVIHTIPAVVALRDALPDARIAWVVESPYRELVEIAAGVEVIPVSMKRWGRHLWESRAAIGQARRAVRGFETAIDFQGLMKSAAVAWLSGAKHRYGFDRTAIREKAAGLFLNHRVPVDTTGHVVDWNLQLAAAVAPQAAPRNIDFTAFADDPTGKLRQMRGAVVCLPGAGKANKQWPPERFGELARAHPNRRFVMAWGPNEKALAEATGLELAPATNLRELAYLLLHASLVVGGDTGPLHLADALGTKVVALFGPTNPARNGPYHQPGNVVETFTSTRSMDGISAHAVAAKVRQVLGE